MIQVRPENKLAIDGITRVDQAVVIASVLQLVKDRKGSKSIRGFPGRRDWLHSGRTKKFASVINLAILVSIQGQPCIGRTSTGPSKSVRLPVGPEVK
jgi:hypothetical protein